MADSLSSWTHRFWQDLMPIPGRMSGTLRIVLASVLTLLFLMVLQLPFAALSLYFVFLIGRDSPSVSLRTGVFLLFTLAMSVATELAIVIVTDNDPMARVLGVAIVTFIAGTIVLGTTLPTLGATWGFTFCTLIELWETPTPADVLVKRSLLLVASSAVAIGCAVAVEYVFGARHPAERLQEQRRIRYEALEKMFSLYAEGADPSRIREASYVVSRLAGAGQREMQELYNQIVDRDLDVGALPVGSRVRITMLAQLMDVSAAFSFQYPEVPDEASRKRCAQIAAECHSLILSKGETPRRPVRPPHEYPTLLDRVEGILDVILSMPSDATSRSDRALVALPSKKVSIVVPGAFQSKETIAFGLKISFCATVCYVFYNAVNWPGIATAVTTVLIAGLSTSGATTQKLILRLVGSAIGGLIFALGATAFLFPSMDSITSLVVLIAIVSFISAWIGAGRHFGYIGLQMALAFYFVAFEGFSAPVELAPARDRLIGILVALIVMWFVFDQIWPVRTVTAMRQALATVLRNEASLFRMEETTKRHRELLRRADTLRDQVGKTMASMRTMNDFAAYEVSVDREQQVHTSEKILRTALTAVALFWNHLAILHSEKDQDFINEPRLASMRKRLADSIDRMAAAVLQKETVLNDTHSALVDAAILDHPRYGEYARNAIARHRELEMMVASLGQQP